MELKKFWKLITAGVLIGAIAVVAAACSGSSTQPTPTATTQAAKNLILSSDMVTGSGGTVKAASTCVLDNVYKPGNQVVFRIRVYDPVTGAQMDNVALSSVTVSLPDGQSFTARYAGHPSTNPLDHFWATSWVIPESYPTGTISYTATATAVDGRTGTFDNFNVQPSLLTVIQ
jgi:hypothetical protein